MGTLTPYLDLYIPEENEKGFAVSKTFRPNFTKLDQECERLELKKMQIEDNVESLIKSTYYKVGDVIQLLGYYTAGDGAGHKRIKSAADDGSGIASGDGNWWNIIPIFDGSVVADWLGAKGNDTDDDTDIIQRSVNAYKKTILRTGKTYLVNGTVQLNNKTLELQAGSVVHKKLGNDPAIWCNGNSFVLRGNGQSSSTIYSDATSPLGVVCIGNKGLDNVGRNVLYGDLRDIDLKATKEVNSFPLALISPQYNGLANYFHTIQNLRLRGGQANLLMWGWSNGNNISNIQLYDSLNYGIWWKGLDNRFPLDNNFSNIFHHSAANTYTVFGEGGSTNIVTGLNCEQGGSGAQSLYLENAVSSCTFIISSNVLGYRTVKNANNNIIDSYGGSKFKNLESDIETDWQAKDLYTKGLLVQGSRKTQFADYSDFKAKEGKWYKLGELYLARPSSTQPANQLLEIYYTTRRSGGISENFGKYTLSTQGKALKLENKIGNADLRFKNMGNNQYEVYVLTVNNGTNTSAWLHLEITLHSAFSLPEIGDNIIFGQITPIETNPNDVPPPLMLLDIEKLDTPYYTSKMKTEGVYNDFTQYMDEKHQYDSQIKHQQETGVMNLIVLQEPQPSQPLIDFKEKYLP